MDQLIRLGIVAALPQEVRCLTPSRVETGSRLPIAPGVELLVCGIGRERADGAARSLVETGTRALVSWGTAAALQPELRSGDVLIPDAVVSGNGTRLAVDSHWRRRLISDLSSRLQVHGGPLSETAHVLADASRKADFGRLTGALAADMESGSILRVAQSAGIPAVVVRVVMDDCHASIPSVLLQSLNDHGRLDLLRLIARILVQPSLIGPLAVLSAAFVKARHSLHSIVRQLGVQLDCPAGAMRSD